MTDTSGSIGIGVYLPEAVLDFPETGGMIVYSGDVVGCPHWRESCYSTHM